MKILLLTSPEYGDFLSKTISSCDNRGHLFLLRLDGEKVNNWDEMDGIGYDIGISFMYQHKIPAKQTNSHTWINFHPGPLPQYKGRNLCYHAIMNGEKEFGATVHYMDENFDTGDIIDIEYFPILTRFTAEYLSLYTLMVSKFQFREYLPRILAEEELVGLPNIGGTYYEKKPIDDFIGITEYQERKIRAITYGEFYPKIDIGGVIYKIVRDE